MTWEKYIMRKKISFLMLSNSGSPIKQFTVSKTYLYFFCLFLTAALISVCFVISDFKSVLSSNRLLSTKISNQNEEIASQRKQIQNFADEINKLKSKLVILNSFEQKIRVIANLEKTSDSDKDSLFGVGGSIPETLDTKIDLLDQRFQDTARKLIKVLGVLYLYGKTISNGATPLELAYELLITSKTLKNEDWIVVILDKIRELTDGQFISKTENNYFYIDLKFGDKNDR